jgi:hypothetical protein
MPNYWLPIMAVAFAGALGLWIALVFRADRNIPDRHEDPLPPREIIGGVFEARRGGRQVMPDPFEPIVHDGDDETSQELPGPAPVTGTVVPEQRKGPVAEQAPREGTAASGNG